MCGVHYREDRLWLSEQRSSFQTQDHFEHLPAMGQLSDRAKRLLHKRPTETRNETKKDNERKIGRPVAHPPPDITQQAKEIFRAAALPISLQYRRTRKKKEKRREKNVST